MEGVCRPSPNEIHTSGSVSNTEGHLNTYRGKAGLYSYSGLQHGNKELLLTRCRQKPEVVESATICFHHEKLLLSKYHLLQRTYCNPFTHCKKIVKEGL
jgi:hypothetical protein